MAQLAHGVGVRDAIGRLKACLTVIPNVAGEPAPVVEILDFIRSGHSLG